MTSTAASPSLVPLETPVPAPAALDRDTQIRSLIAQARAEALCVGLANQDIRECGQRFWLLKHRTEPDLWKVVPGRCNHRLCPTCSRIRAARLADNIRRLCENVYLRKVELTLRSTAHPLDEQLDRLIRCFRRLRRTPLWRHAVKGGIAVLQVTRNADTGLWHPHLHIVYTGTYLAQPALRQQWLTITGDSDVVWVKYVPPACLERTIRDVAWYIAKPFTLDRDEDPDPNRLLTPDECLAFKDLARALHDRKTVFTIGAWRRERLLSPTDPAEWTKVCHEAELPYMFDHDPVWIATVRTVWAAVRTSGAAGTFNFRQPLPRIDPNDTS